MKTLFAAITILLFLSVLTSKGHAQVTKELEPCVGTFVNSQGQVQYREVVFEIRDSMVKAGFYGASKPCIVIAAVVGEFLPGGNNMNMTKEPKTYFGKEAYEKRAMLTLAHPIQQGVIKDRKAWQKLLTHILEDKLKINPEKHQFLLTESV